MGQKQQPLTNGSKTRELSRKHCSPATPDWHKDSLLSDGWTANINPISFLNVIGALCVPISPHRVTSLAPDSCSRLNRVSKKKTCPSLNPSYLRMWLYLEVGTLQILLSEDEVILVFKWVLSSMTGIIRGKRGKFETHRHRRDTGKKATWRRRSRLESRSHQPRNTRSHQKWEEAGRIFP